MTETISRIYASRQNADAAVAGLLKAGFADSAIDLVALSDEPGADVAAQIAAGGVADTHVDALAEAVRRGETLVSIRAQFGTGALATRTLQRHRPTQIELPDKGYAQQPGDPAAPLSAALGWPLLSRDPAPLSSAFGLSVLTKSRPMERGGSPRPDNPAPFSRMIGQPVLTNTPAPLSSATGARVLWDDPAPLSERLHVPVLTGQSKSAVRAGMGQPDRPAPFSGLFGLKLLLNDPAPLSRLFGLRVLSDEPKP